MRRPLVDIEADGDAESPLPRGVLLVNLAEKMGGAEKRVVQLAIELQRRAIPVLCVCLKEGALAPRLRDAGLSTVDLPGGKGNPRHAVALARILAGHRGWTVDAHNAQSQLWCLAASALARSGPAVATVHSEYRSSEAGGRGRRHEWVLRRVAAAGWRFIAVTDSVGTYVSRLSRDNPVSVVWSAVETAPVQSSDEKLAVRESLGLSPEQFVVLCAGRLIRVKAFHHLIEAVSRLVPSAPALRLVIVGEGPELDRLRRSASVAGLDGRVVFAGFRKDAERLIAAADLVVLPSLTEGLPYVLLEAAAAGTPIVATSVGSIPEVFAPDRALLVHPGAPAELAAAIERVMADPSLAAQLARRASDLTLGSHSAGSMVDATLRAYEGTLRTPAGASS